MIHEQERRRMHDNLRLCVFKKLIVFNPWGLYGLFWGWGNVKKCFFVSTHIAEQLLFCIFASILKYTFELIFG